MSNPLLSQSTSAEAKPPDASTHRSQVTRKAARQRVALGPRSALFWACFGPLLKTGQWTGVLPMSLTGCPRRGTLQLRFTGAPAAMFCGWCLAYASISVAMEGTTLQTNATHSKTIQIFYWLIFYVLALGGAVTMYLSFARRADIARVLQRLYSLDAEIEEHKDELVVDDALKERTKVEMTRVNCFVAPECDLSEKYLDNNYGDDTLRDVATGDLLLSSSWIRSQTVPMILGTLPSCRIIMYGAIARILQVLLTAALTQFAAHVESALHLTNKLYMEVIGAHGLFLLEYYFIMFECAVVIIRVNLHKANQELITVLERHDENGLNRLRRRYISIR